MPANDDIQAPKEKYETALRIFTDAANRSRAALGEVKPLGAGPMPEISDEWVEAMEAERLAEAAYVEARDAYWKAVGEQRNR